MTRKASTAVLAFTLATGLTATGVATAAPNPDAATQSVTVAALTKNDRVFVKLMKKYAPDVWAQGTSEGLVRIGKATCRLITSGSVADAHKVARKYMTESDAAVLVILSGAVYCPRHNKKIDKFYGISQKV